MGAKVVAALLSLTLGLALTAQEPVQPPRFRSGVDVIRIEVSVLDGNRRPLRGLSLSDFTVLQDGESQEVVAFEEVSIRENDHDAPPWSQDVAPDVQTNAAPEGRLIVLLLDDAMEPGLFVHRTRDIAKHIIDRLGPDDRAAVVFTRDNSAAQEFTADRTRLHAAIARFSMGFVFSQPVGDRTAQGDFTYFRSSIDTIGEIAKSLVEIPHRRKLLVYVGIGVPQSIEDATTAPVPGSEVGSNADLQGLSAGAIGALADALRRARVANISVYAIDSAGLGGLDGYAIARKGFGRSPNAMRDYLHTISNATGGRAAVEVENYQPAVDRIFSENDSYYLIGYRARTPLQDGKFRRLEVKVNRRGVLVRARSGFEAPRASGRNTATPSPLVKALSGVLPDDGIAMQVTAVPFATAGRDVAVIIVAGVRHPTVPDQPIQDVELLTTAFTPDGRSRHSTRQNARVRLRAGATADASYEVLSQITLKPGRYNLRVASHHPLLARTGSVFYDLQVPDFDREELVLSGMLVTSTPPPPIAPKDALVKITSVVPTSRRFFAAGDSASVVLRVYQRRGKDRRAVTMDARVASPDGSTAFTRRDVLAADQFGADRTSEYRLDLPLERLAAGDHLLTVEASAGSHASRRDLRFRVH